MSDYDDDDSRPITLDRREHNRRKLVRWNPDFSMGSVGIIVAWLGSMAVAYGQYIGDKREAAAVAVELRRDVDANQAAMTNGLDGLRVEVKDMARTLQDVSTNIAVLKARQDPMARPTPGAKP